jgi:uncharacterized Zn finger protein
MDAVDGNAIAAALFDRFGHEMTMAAVRCAHCRSTSMIAELRVYMRAPGSVARCRVCGQVVMVIVEVRGTQRVDMSNMEIVNAS